MEHGGSKSNKLFGISDVVEKSPAAKSTNHVKRRFETHADLEGRL
jgi:hypothetical protein